MSVQALSQNVNSRAGYEQRQLVPENLRPWDVESPGYSPVDFTSETVLKQGFEQGWADPVSPSEVDFSQRLSFEGELRFDKKTGRPLNPKGRQGIQGRGGLGKWGVNNTADSIVIAVGADGARKILLIRRKDTKQWAIPGGMVDPGEHVSATARRELKEEAGIDLDEVPSFEIVRGYVDDPRNTDNAWTETVAAGMVISYTPEAQAGDDADDSQWFDLPNVESLQKATGGLYASHDQLVRHALDKLNTRS